MGPFQVLKRLGENAYLLELPLNLHFNQIFNVEDLYIYHGHHNDVSEELDLQLPPTLSPHLEIEYVLDDQLVSIRQGGYQIFLVKWRGKPHAENTWITTTDFQKFTPIFMNCIKHLTCRGRVLSSRGELMGESLLKFIQGRKGRPK